MKSVIVGTTFIWIGLILGISFLEAPLKFKAPHMTLELGLGIGKLVFTALNRVEIFAAILIGIGLVAGKYPRKLYFLYVFPLAILSIQTLWLLPTLNVRIDTILSGESVPKSFHHLNFIILEVLKVLGLFVSGIVFMKHSKAV